MGELRDEIRGEIRKGLQKDWEKKKRKNPGCNADSWWEERILGIKIFLGILMGIVGLCLLFFFGGVVMFLWNWLIPTIFGL